MKTHATTSKTNKITLIPFEVFQKHKRIVNWSKENLKKNHPDILLVLLLSGREISELELGRGKS